MKYFEIFTDKDYADEQIDTLGEFMDRLQELAEERQLLLGIGKKSFIGLWDGLHEVDQHEYVVNHAFDWEDKPSYPSGKSLLQKVFNSDSTICHICLNYDEQEKKTFLEWHGHDTRYGECSRLSLVFRDAEDRHEKDITPRELNRAMEMNIKEPYVM